MSGADRRDAEDVAWLEARERGAATLPPIEAARAAAYGELQGLIAALPDEAAPAGWEVDVMAALATASPAPRAPVRGRRRWVRGAAGVAAVAGVAALVIVLQPPVAPDAVPAMTIVRGQGGRGDGTAGAAIGDVLRVDVAAGAGELRIYRDDREVVARCPGQAGCTQAAGHLTVELPLTAPGRYRAVYLQPAPRAPLREPTGTLDGDLASCRCESRTAAPVMAR